MSDNTNKGKLLMQIEVLRAQVEQLNHEIEGWKLLQRNQAETIGKYQAQVEALRESSQPILDDYFRWMTVNKVDISDLNESYQNVYDMMTNLKDALLATPSQCLAEVRAQAVEDAIEAVHSSSCVRLKANAAIRIDFLGDYARKLRG